MFKKWTLLWREAHFGQKCIEKNSGLEHFLTFRCRFLWQAQGIVHPVQSQKKVGVLYGFVAVSPKTNSSPLHYNYTCNYHYTTLFTLHYTTLHPSTVHYTTLHYTSLHFITLPYTTLHYTIVHHTTLHYATLPCATLHYTALTITTGTTTTTLRYTNYITLRYATRRTTTTTANNCNYIHYTTLH